ncbi:leucine-rich_repeat domain-containing protein [Hexamita inflata]|uniref:Leucine-rich repeat domain-containing protein n=1 Tax=Hexamita inflata TaxID=28002 RepID=A0AA86S5P4_9EUKA|nr:leucine-rich repeat domain-containing protein [Hexamita inflata]
MNEYNLNALNEDDAEYMTRKYQRQIKDGNLEIGDDPEVTNLRFLEQFNISNLNLCISNIMSVKLRSSALKKITMSNLRDDEGQQQRLNMQVDDLELENLEVLDLADINLENDQLYNLAKFKKLHTLDVSFNKVDLTHIHSVTSLTKLYMQECGLRNIELISSLVNLKELDLSQNRDIDLSQLQQVRSLTKLTMLYSGLTNIDQIAQLINLEVLNISDNQLLTINSIGSLVNLKELNISYNKQIDIAPLKDLVGLIKLYLNDCELKQVSALKHLINLQTLYISYNYDINITELQYLKNLTHLNLNCCNLVSIYVLGPLVNLEYLYISFNNIVYLDADINEMSNLKELSVQQNLVSDFSSIEQHQNFNNINEIGDRCFDISNQKDPLQEELYLADMMRKIKIPNIQLKEIQNLHQSLKTELDNFKQEINMVLKIITHNEKRIKCIYAYIKCCLILK